MNTNHESKASSKTTLRLKPVMVIAAILATVVLGLLITRDTTPNPVWEGRPLSHYLDQLPLISFSDTGGGVYAIHSLQNNKRVKLSKREAVTEFKAQEQMTEIPRKAIVAIGTNGLPLLMRQLASKETIVERRMSNSPKWLQRLLSTVGIRVSPSATHLKRWQAVAAMRELHEAGLDLSPVLEDLLDLATNQNANIRIAATFLAFQIESTQHTALHEPAEPLKAPSTLTGEQGN